MEKRNDKKLLAMLEKSEALLTGHFLLSSGLHSDRYIQCAKLTQHPEYCTYVAESLSEMYKNQKVDVVIGGAFGGIILAFEIGRALNKRAIFAERVDNIFALRRGFEIKENENVLIAEDVCTTGKSILEVAELVKNCKANIVGAAVIIDRCEDKGQNLGMRKEWLQSVEAKTYDAGACQLCKDDSVAVKPGSRK